jgi:ABC-type uncharacterized transport system permease subunit
VEQNVPLTLEASQRVYIMEKGAIRHHAKASDLKVGDDVIKAISRSVGWQRSFAFFADFPVRAVRHPDLNGIVTGMILALIASGLTLIFGIMDVVNFAHGELFMLGAYVGVIVLSTTGNFWLALILATLLVGLFGAAMQIVTLRPAARPRSADTILATFGVSLILQNYALCSSVRWRARSTNPSPALQSLLPWNIPGIAW